MSERSNQYEIILRKDNLKIEVFSDDVYFISRQMDRWCQVLMDEDLYSINPGLKKPEPPRQSPQSETPITPEQSEPADHNPESESTLETEAIDAPQEASPPEPEPKQETHPEKPPQSDEPVSTEQSETQTEAVSSTETDKEDTHPPSPEPEQAKEKKEPLPKVPASQLSEDIEDDFEAVMDSLMQDLGKNESEEKAPSNHSSSDGDETAFYMSSQGSISANGGAPSKPDGVSEQGDENGKAGAQIDLEMIHNLDELCQRVHLNAPEDTLVIASYYLSFFEAEEKFTLKRINSLLVDSKMNPVNHSVLESSLSKKHLAMVPDMTGMADVTEYSLTNDGQEYAESLIH
jgi:chemotaxis protein histidine kinase CheA